VPQRPHNSCPNGFAARHFDSNEQLISATYKLLRVENDLRSKHLVDRLALFNIRRSRALFFVRAIRRQRSV
jgi:hypothetical protein